MPEGSGAGAGANIGDELLGVSNSARSMRVPWLFPGWVKRRGIRIIESSNGCATAGAGPWA